LHLLRGVLTWQENAPEPGKQFERKKRAMIHFVARMDNLREARQTLLRIRGGLFSRAVGKGSSFAIGVFSGGGYQGRTLEESRVVQGEGPGGGSKNKGERFL